MNNLIKLKASELSALFSQTAVRMGVTRQIVEKDFWVCWLLKKLFESELSDDVIFKGGTSLSKVYGVIERFSEDIDLILNWEGNSAGDPMAERSKRGQETFNTALLEWGNATIRDRIFPVVAEICGEVCQPSLEVAKTGDYIIAVTYPHVERQDEYLRPEIRLEIGALAAWEPYRTAEIRPYAAECYPGLFTDSAACVKVTTAERTFWEKATILHVEAGRPESNSFRQRYARHYYDMVMLARRAELKASALADLPLLERVVEFKRRFYGGSKWMGYDKAKPGSFRLLPPAHFLKALEDDYHAMKDMIYGEYPDLSTILAELATLEGEINSLG